MCSISRLFGVELLHRADGREQEAEPDVDEVHAGDRKRDVARQRHPLVENAVDELDQRDLLLQRWRRGAHSSGSSPAKLYGGHGPVSSYVTPSAPNRSSSSDTAWRSARSRPAATRYAPLRIISPPATSGACTGFARASTAAAANRSWLASAHDPAKARTSSSSSRSRRRRNMYARPPLSSASTPRDADSRARNACASRSAFTPSSSNPSRRPSRTAKSCRSPNMARTSSSPR